MGILFDANRLNEELARGLQKLVEMQEEDGSWPWFPGGRPNDYITLYITTGFGRLRHLGVDIDVAPAVRSLTRLDAWIDERYREIVARGHKDKNNLSSTIALYLYGRSFFLDDQPIAPEHKEAIDYFLRQAREYWTKLGCRQSQAHLAIALKRFRRQADTAGHHEVAQRTQRLQRGTGHVLARHGTLVVVVPRADRDPGVDDRGV